MRFGFSRFKSKKEFTKLVDSLWEKPHVKRKDHGNYWPLQSGLVWQKDDTQPKTCEWLWIMRSYYWRFKALVHGAEDIEDAFQD